MKRLDPITSARLDWSTPDAAMPPRSRLIRLAPIGAGTARAEGLVSYLVRLARAHSANPRSLVRSEFVAVRPEIAEELTPSFFRIAARTVEGLGSYARHFSQAASTLTRAGDLGHLTLLPLRHLLPHNGEGLLARHPKWCPSCLAEMAASGREPFRPLAWSFHLYWYCSIHQHRLADRCPACGNAQHVISRYPSVCHCSQCGSWLGSEEIHEDMPLPVDQWIAVAVEDVVAHLPALEAWANQGRFLRFLAGAVEETTAGNRTRFCQLMGLNARTLENWFGGIRPSFPQWLSVAHGLGVRPTQFLTGNVPVSMDHLGLYERPAALTLPYQKPPMSADERNKLGAILAGIATDPDDTASVAEVARRLGRDPGNLKHCFPDLCDRIRGKYVAAIQVRAAQRCARDARKVEEVVRSFVERGEYPGEGKVNRRLRKLGVALVRPELRQLYRDAVARMAGHWKPPATNCMR